MNILRALVRIRDFFLQDVFKPNNWSYDVDDFYGYDYDEYEVLEAGDDIPKYTFVDTKGNKFDLDFDGIPNNVTLDFEIEYLDPDQVLDAMEIEVSITPYTEDSDVDDNQSNYEDSFTA